MYTHRPLFRHSTWDVLPVLGGFAHVAFLLWTFLAYPECSWPVVAAAFAMFSLLICWNLQCVSHNFIHNPFFTNDWLNRAFGVLETIAIGMPHQLLPPLPHEPPRRRQRRQGPERHHPRLVVASIATARTSRPSHFGAIASSASSASRSAPCSASRRHGRANLVQVAVETVVLAAVLAGHGRGQLAIISSSSTCRRSSSAGC